MLDWFKRKIKANLIRIIQSSHKELHAFRRPYIKRKCIEGVSFDFLIGDPEGMDWYDINCTDPWWPEMRVLRDHILEEGDIIFECGGHHGCTAILLSHWIGNTGKVFSFEPNPNNVSIFKTNIEINHIKNIIVEQKAVGSMNTTVKLAADASNSHVMPKNSPDNTISNIIEVSMIQLDNYIDLKPTLLKIDVEGNEIEVLKGAKNILKHRPKLTIEVHKNALINYDSKLEELFSLIDFDIYDIWVQWNDEIEINKWHFEKSNNTINELENFDRTHLFLKPKNKNL